MRFKSSPEDNTDPADGPRLGSGARRAPDIKPQTSGIGLNSVPEWLRDVLGSSLAQKMIDQTRMQRARFERGERGPAPPGSPEAEAGLDVAGAFDFTGSIGKAVPLGPKGITIEPQKFGRYIIQDDGKEVGRVSLAGDGEKPFVDIVNVDPAYQRRGIASSAYDFIEKDIGRRLLPSPLGLSEAATEVWRKRLANVPKAEREALLDESKQVGLSYMPSGMPDSELKIRDQWIESRLAPFRNLPAMGGIGLGGGLLGWGEEP